MANEFVAKNGLISQNNTTVSGSLTVTQGITGSLYGTASWAESASWAPTQPGGSPNDIQYNDAGTLSGTGGNFRYNSVSNGVELGGLFAQTTGPNSFAHGLNAQALGDYSHAHGDDATAQGIHSHAEGNATIALGGFSYVGGLGTIASGSYQYAIGSYNLQNNSTSLLVIGNGTNDTNRSDLLRVNPSEIEITGSLIVSGTTTVYGNLLPGGPYTSNTSSYDIGSPTAAWKDIYVSNGSIYFISGSSSGSLSFQLGTGIALTGSLDGTASYALTASYAMNGGGGTPIDTSSLVTTASFNAFTASAVTQTDTDYEYLLISSFRTTYNY